MGESVDPTLAATLPLAGVVIGALLGGIVRRLLDGRAEVRHTLRARSQTRREVLAAMRILIDELDRLEAILGNLLRAPQTEPLHVRPADAAVFAALLETSGWREVRPLLAREVSTDEWVVLRQAAVQASTVASALLLKQDTDLTLASLKPKIDKAIRAVRQGQSVTMKALGAPGRLQDPSEL